VERRAYAPGQHGQGKQRKLSNYGVQLREKQKLKRTYGVREGQFRIYVKEAVRRPGVTGENLLQLLEMRLDNTVYRLGLAASRAQARQFVSHRHIKVNGKRVNIASYLLRPNQVVEVDEGARKIPPLVAALESAGGRALPTWLQFDAREFKGQVVSAPLRDEIDTDVQESLIIEFYSR
jgi:small subunit ribosomal protein S4